MPTLTEYGNVIGTFAPYTDVNVWYVLIIISVIFMILSLFANKNNVICGIISLLSALAVVESSLSLAHIRVNSVVVNNTLVHTSVVEVIASPWLTTFCRVWFVLTFLGLVWTLIQTLIPRGEVMT